MRLSQLFSFPSSVNTNAARTVAAGVVLLVVSIEVTKSPVLLALLLYGFVARSLSGPRFSPLGQLAVRVITPRIGPGRSVSGSPKRFAQCIGLVFSLTAAALVISGSWTAAEIVLAILGLFALLESALGFCAGCSVFATLQRWGVISNRCVECANIYSRQVPTGMLRSDH
jgi:hypothetical protein